VLAAAPALGELGDEEEAAAAFVEGAGAAQVGEVLLASDTSTMRVASWMRRSRMGGAACRMALVTSSLTTSSVVKTRSSSPHAASRSAA
jgi:hypothetical protein